MNKTTTDTLSTRASIQDYPPQRRSTHSYQIMVVGNGDTPDLMNIPGNPNIVNYSDYPEAAFRLQHLPANHQYPDVIIGPYDIATPNQLTDFGRFLTNHKKLSEIPFILADQNQIKTTKSSLPQIPGVDDIVRNDITTKELVKKITLLKKFKSLKQLKFKLVKVDHAEIRADRPPLYRIDTILKRVMDILIASVAIIILSPLMLIISIIIKIDSKGPIFYTSYRAGSNYRIFKFIKFRTMVTEAAEKLSTLKNLNQYSSSDQKMPTFFKISDDPRITRFGKLLRNTSLDELPQLLNVLKGDMSLVGNRPLPLYEAKTLTTDKLAERFNAPAGITGLWQISKRGQKEMSVEERLALDINYARHNSFVQDLQIMLKTPKALIQKDNV